MKLSAVLRYTGDAHVAARQGRELEAAGVEMLWVTEAYTFDSVSLLGFLAAQTRTAELATGVLSLYSRTPALIAMTAAGLDAVSRGRFVLGLGSSGPQVVEGWHGVPYRRPIACTRDIIEICRMVWRREVLQFDGEVYRLPLPPDQGCGLGKPLKLINHPVRPRIPIYVGSNGPQNVRLTAELADGWIPALFDPDHASSAWDDDIHAGLSVRSSDLAPLEIVAGSVAAICDADRAEQLRDSLRPKVALYVGGMGAPGKNFYYDNFCRYGYEHEAEVIQKLYLTGRKQDAAAAVPESFLRSVAMVGDEGWVRDRVLAYRDAGVTRLDVDLQTDDPAALADKIRCWTA